MIRFEVRGDGSTALSPASMIKGIMRPIERNPITLGSTATHEPIEIKKSLWVRWKPLEAQGSKPCGQKHHKAAKNTLKGRAVDLRFG